ncbi:MAG: FAD-binding protein [Deltaproteobacteria bacterium]|nr:FAD-binding protein [Deltaproteobacteria bacterium]
MGKKGADEVRAADGLTRRSFLGGAAAGAALTGAAGSLACAAAEGPADGGPFDRETDVVVVGAGTGLAGALAAAVAGAEVLVLEKRVVPGGTTSISGGVAWVPNNAVMRAEGIRDSREQALTYVRTLSQGQADEELIEAFVDRGPEMATFLEENSPLRWRVSKVMGAVADYHPEWEGSVLRGRSIEPDVDAERLFFGGDLINYLLQGVDAAGAEIVTDAVVQRLIVHRNSDGDAEVLGVEAVLAGEPVRIRARRGVLLAAGGFGWNSEMRQHFLRGPSLYALGVNSATGDGIRMAQAVGADLRNMNECWGITCYKGPAEEQLAAGGGPSIMAQVEKAFPGSISVNRYGERFANEAGDYDSTWRSYLAWENWGELRYRNIPAFQISDAKVRRERSMAGRTAQESLPDWIVQAPTLRELAEKLGIDPDGLERTVVEFNRHARGGLDPAFHRGESAYDRRGDPSPSVTLAPVEEPPFYGTEVSPAHLDTSGGARVNRHAQVLNPFGQPIARLYASGNNAGVGSPGASYGGGGGTIGPALTFAYIAGRHAAGLDDGA